MDNNKISKDDIFICNAQECFNINQHQASYLNDKATKPQNKNNIKCSLCAYDFDTFEELRNQIYAETKRNKQVKNNILKTKIFEFAITIGLVVIVLCAVLYFLTRAYLISL